MAHTMCVSTSLALRLMRSTLSGLALLLSCQFSHASLQFAWGFVDWEPVVQLAQPVLLRAQLFNLSTSDEALRGDSLLERMAEGLEDRYSFSEAPVPLADQLRGLVLAPGQSADFVFGQLVPIGGAVAPGRYLVGGFALAWADAQGQRVEWSPDRDLLVEARDAGDSSGGGHSVPEPSAPALLALAAAAAWLARRHSPRPGRRA